MKTSKNPTGQEICLEPSPMAKDVAVFSNDGKPQPVPVTAGLPSKSIASVTKKKSAVGSNPPPNKARRVRTGCLTCRERHLKCDEAMPDCMNCRKRGRECKRGIRLNFLDINVHSPEHVAELEDWTGEMAIFVNGLHVMLTPKSLVEFQDESREIASEYRGGLSRYAPYDSKDGVSGNRARLDGEVKSSHSTCRQQSSERSPRRRLALQNLKQEQTEEIFNLKLAPTADWKNEQTNFSYQDEYCHPQTNSDVSNVATPPSSCQSSTPYGEQPMKLPVTGGKPSSPYRNSEPFSPFSIRTPATVTPMTDFEFSFNVPENAPLQAPMIGNSKTSERDCLNTSEEIRYMQAFVEEVGIWLDSFNKERYFSLLIPHYALKSTMLLNALLACGAKHVSLTSSDQGDKALFYHNTATSQLLRSLQNPDRNTEECATTAVILNVYEFMSEQPAQRMRHIGGARALILECGWNANSSGTGRACFWQNITMEVLICLSKNWLTSWDPEKWGLNHHLIKEGEEELRLASDEVFVHMILYIIARIVNFRARILNADEGIDQNSEERRGSRCSEWQDLKHLCERWNRHCPRTMRSYGYIGPSNSPENSLFPYIWLMQRTAILGRLFYHTAECLLAQHHPLEHVRCSEGTKVMRLHHSHQVCGIVAHSQDHGIAPVAIHCLAAAAAVLTEPKEQVEVLEMMDKIKKHSGWHLGAVEMELKRAWGWEPSRLLIPRFGNLYGESCAMPPPLRPSGMRSLPNPITPLMAVTRVLTPPVAAMASVNPLSFADFSLPNHPYQNWYEPANRLGSEANNEW